jgi:plasmid replication initiation protein
MAKVLHKSKTPKVYKSKKLNNARLEDFTLNDYQVYLLIISKLGKVDNMGKYLQPEVLERNITITAKEFAQAFDIEISYAYRILYGAAKKLARKAITVHKPEIKEIWEIPVCKLAKYNTKSGNLSLELNEHIMPHLAQVKEKFVLYNLKEIANFGSLYSTRLYELIQEFKDTGYLLKSVAELRHIFDVGKRYKLYGDFKRKTFAHAVEEINSNYEMDLRFEELNENNEAVRLKQKVTAIKFFFKPTFIRKFLDPYTSETRNIYIKPKRKKKIETQSVVDENQQELDLT